MVKVSRHFAKDTRSLELETQDAGVSCQDANIHEKRKSRLGTLADHRVSILQCALFGSNLFEVRVAAS
jgi:hypothetical protein